MTKGYIYRIAQDFNLPFVVAVSLRKSYLVDHISILSDHLIQLKILATNHYNDCEKLLVLDMIKSAYDRLRLLQIEYTKLKEIDFTQSDFKDEIDIEEILRVPIEQMIGIKPKWVRGNEQVYFSPLRDDGAKPSFTVTVSKNLWFDFSLGEGGNVIDLYMKMHNCNFKTAIKELSRFR